MRLLPDRVPEMGDDGENIVRSMGLLDPQRRETEQRKVSRSSL